MHSVSSRRLHGKRRDWRQVLSSKYVPSVLRTQKHAENPSAVSTFATSVRSHPRFTVATRFGIFAFAFLFVATMISSSGVSPFIGSEVLIANSAGAVDNNNIVSFSGSWGTLKLPDSDSVVRDNQFSASTRSSLREEDVITGAVALNGDIIVAPENYIGNPNATLATGNTYAPGYCTWYAYNRRIEMGLPALTSWGHAYQWVSGAGASGYKVDHNPQIGDIISIDGGWLGHVAIVEELGPNNTVRISEMNYGYVYNYNERWIINATQYSYIH